MTRKVIRRFSAINQGLTRYFTGKPCKNGHVAERLTANGDCIICKRSSRSDWARRNRDCYNAYYKRWCKENPQAAKEMRRRGWIKWAAKNQEYIAEKTREYAKANPEMRAAATNRYRARKMNCSGSYTAEQAAELLIAQEYLCAYCDADLRTVKKAVDHWMPLSRGGSNDISNLQWLCMSCNSRKSNRDPLEFEREIFGCPRAA